MLHFASSENRQRSNHQMSVCNEVPVKLEVEDSLEDEHGPFSKRQKQSSAPDQATAGNSSFSVSPSQYNPLDEPSPLGLRLRKSPSLLELIQMRLSQGNSSALGSSPSDNFKSQEKVNAKGSSGSTTSKLKASNFPASLLRIGSWECNIAGNISFRSHMGY